MKIKLLMKDVLEILKNTFSGFSDDKVTKLSGSLAYSTLFSIGPLLIVVIAVCGIFFGQDAVEGKIYYELAQFLGRNAAIELQTIVKNAAISGKNTMAITIGSIVLFLGATSVFSEIQDSINGIWGIKPKPKKNWLKMIQNRFLSFSVIVSFGFLLLVSLTISAIIDGMGHKLQVQFPGMILGVFYVLNLVATLVIITLIFAVIFKVLPDAKIKWKDVTIGSLLTAVFFMLGKFAISYYIANSNVTTAFGATGSVLVLIVWVYYSSLILYLGAEFTKSYAIKYGSEILPSEYAVTTKQVEIETDKQSIQEKEKTAKTYTTQEESKTC